MPYFSPMIARLGSRPTENVAPIASRLMPSNNASGKPEQDRADEVAEFLKRQRPARRGELRQRAADQQAELRDEQQQRGLQDRGRVELRCARRAAPALFQRSLARPSAAPSSSAQIIGSSTTLPGPTLNVNDPMNSAMNRMTAA